MARRSLAYRTLVGLVALAAVLLAHPGTSSATDDTITVQGRYERLAAVGTTGESALHAVRTGKHTYWLDLGPNHVPQPGALVTVSGHLEDGRTLDVSSIGAVEGSAARTAAPASHRADKVLVMRAFWTRNRPARPTTAQTRSTFLRKGKAWFEEVSHGRYSITGTVTPWLRIPRPSGCTYSAYESMDRALTRAKRAGFNLNAYSRYVLYLPCNGQGMLGLGSMPGPFVWQFGSLSYDIAVHEQGHNLGLRHANGRECYSGSTQVTWSRSCNVVGYGDSFDVMGNRGPGHFQAFHKQRLGWLQKLATLSRSGTRSLAPYATTGPGAKALRVKASRSRSYWLEYRTKSGVDSAFAPGAFGVVLRVRGNGSRSEPQLLDLMPGSGFGRVGGRSFHEWDRTRLPAGSSWTSPERIRFTTTSQTSGAARVSVQFNAPAPRAPDAPASVTATPLVNGADVTWERPADNGSIITKYVVTASPGQLKQTVKSVGGLRARTRFTGLDPARDYTFSVVAHNQKGGSAPQASQPVTPLSSAPTVSITSPGDGATVSGQVTVLVKATKNAHSGAAIDYVDLLIDGIPFDYDESAPYEFDWDTPLDNDGPHTLTAIVHDRNGESAESAPIEVTVANGAP